MNLKDAIKKRKSVRRFSSKKPDWRKIVRAIDAARYAPSAGNQFVTKFILVQDEGKIVKLAAACQQEFVGTAKAVVVVATEDKKLERLYGDKARRYAGQQAGAAIQNFLLELTEEGLVTCWVGHFHEETVSEILGSKGSIEAVFPIGHETKIKTKEKPEKELEQMIFFDKWGGKKMQPEARLETDII